MMNAAIVGWGHTRFGKMDALSIEDLIIAAAQEAIGDAGIAPSDIDALWLGQFNSGVIADGFFAPSGTSVQACHAMRERMRLGRLRRVRCAGRHRIGPCQNSVGSWRRED